MRALRASIDPDLTHCTDLAVCLVDTTGTFLSSSAKHAARLGSPVAGVLGRSWRDWTPAADFGRVEPLFAQALAGSLSSLVLTALRPDGRVATSRAALIPTVTVQGAPAVLAVHSTIYIPRLADRKAQAAALDVGAYVAELAGELQRLADATGLRRLSDALHPLTTQAGDTEALVARVTRLM